MTEGIATHPLPYWPHDADLTPVKEAFERHGKGKYAVQPVPYRAGTHDRVLALGEAPEHLVDYAMFAPERGADVLLWATHQKDFERGPMTVLKQLREIFGEGVVEIEVDNGESGLGGGKAHDSADTDAPEGADRPGPRFR